jgi:hypothetical protein
MCEFMKIKRRVVFTLSIFACQSLQAALPARTVSPSQQFLIYGANAELRGAVSELAEQTKSNLLVCCDSLIGGKRRSWSICSRNRRTCLKFRRPNCGLARPVLA